MTNTNGKTTLALDNLTREHTAFRTFEALMAQVATGWTPSIRDARLARAIKRAGGRAWNNKANKNW